MNSNMEYVNGEYRHMDHLEGRELPDKSTTLLQMLKNVVKRKGSSDFLGTVNRDGKLIYESYQDVHNKIIVLGRNLKDILSVVNKDSIISYESEKGMNDNVLPLVGIFSINRAEWIISEYAVYTARCTICPLYSTFGTQSLKHIMNETQMRICFVSGAKALALAGSDCAELKVVICYDELGKDVVDLFSAKGIQVVFYSEMLSEDFNFDLSESRSVHKNSHGKKKTARCIYADDQITADDVATVCYTSGTSGVPKGVLLTHLNFISSILGFFLDNSNRAAFRFKNDDVYFSYLPLAHVMERVIVSIVTANGAKIAFFRGNPKILAEDMKLIKPSVFVGVPRVFNVFRDKITEEIKKKSIFIQWLIFICIWIKKKFMKRRIYNLPIIDTFIFSKIKEAFGGRIRGCLNGSAPIAKDVVDFLQAVLSTRIFQGYGQTESNAASILQTIDDSSTDNVGVPFPSNRIKLRPVDDFPDPNTGEILIKGLNVTRGYYKRPDLNKELFDDGWLVTGDIASIVNNKFRIIARVKDTFKTSLGEYINPEKIESYFNIDTIDDIFICGRSTGDFICAIVVCKDKRISQSEILNKIQELGNNKVAKGEMARFEIPRAIIVKRVDFSEYGELLTPTMKKKRTIFYATFKEEIDELYKKK